MGGAEMGRGIKNLARTRNNGSRASIYAFRSRDTERGVEQEFQKSPRTSLPLRGVNHPNSSLDDSRGVLNVRASRLIPIILLVVYYFFNLFNHLKGFVLFRF